MQPTAPSTRQVDETLLGGVAAAMALVKAHRMHGHLAARLDPLGSEPMGDPALDETRLIPSLTPELQAQIPSSLLRVHVPGETLLEALPALKEVYCGTIAYEIEHLSDHAERVWLRQAIESGRYRKTLEPEERKRLLASLTRAEGFEQFLRKRFLGQKQFSLEGLDSMMPMLDEAIELAASMGAHEVVIGMAHRGRLNVLVHTTGHPYGSVLREFEGERTIDAVVMDEEGGTGDVKYHLPATGTRATSNGEVTISLAPNPSHLEAVDPVIEGWTRAEQTDRSSGGGIHDPFVALAILIHGDASFAGQGIVAETLNLSNLDGYTTGGTLHIISNNQVGFTTDPEEGRSTRYSSDLAKGFDIPIIHVNADDPEAAVAAVRLALAYRQEFGHDVVVDLVGYRRFGHQEQDEAAYTQPLMVAQIEAHPTAREQYVARLIGEGVLTQAEADALFDETQAELRAAHEELTASIAERAPCEGRFDSRRYGRGGGHGRLSRAAGSAERAAPRGAGRLRGSPEAPEAARAPPDDARDGNRLGARGVARLRDPARRRDLDPALGSGQRAGNVRAPPRGPARPAQRRAACAAPGSPRGRGRLRDLQLPALGVRLPRIRVRLLGRGARVARALGGAVRRLRERRPDRDRPVPRRGALEVAAELPADAPPTARL